MIGFILSDLGIVVDISGTLGAATIAFTTPAFIFYRIFPDRRAMRGLAVFTFFFGLFVTISGMILIFV